MRRAPQLGQNPRHLQLNATRCSAGPICKRALAQPRTPHAFGRDCGGYTQRRSGFPEGAFIVDTGWQSTRALYGIGRVYCAEKYSRKILSWRLSNSMDSAFCVDALEEAIYRYGTPEIFNSDQGAQFTSDAFISVLKAHQIQISMDGRGAWRDNIFVERLWRSVKYEEVYLNAYESMAEAKSGIGNWIEYYNHARKHQTLGTTPELMYAGSSSLRKAA